MRPDLTDWQDKAVYDSHGEKVGTVKGLFVDKESQQPEWLVVDSGLVGPEVLVPITGLEEVDGGIQLPFTEDQVKNAPSIGDADVLTADQERDLYDYYGIPYSTDESSTILPKNTGQGGMSRQGKASGLGLMSARETGRQDAAQQGTTSGHSDVMAGDGGTTGSRQSLTGQPVGSGGDRGQGVTPQSGQGMRVRKRVVTTEEYIDDSGEPVNEEQTGFDEEEPGRRAA